MFYLLALYSTMQSPTPLCITSDEEGEVVVRNYNTFQEVLTLKGHTGPVRSVCLSPDGKRILTGSKDHTAKVWDLKTGQELLTLKGHTDRVSGVSFSPDGKRIFTISWDKTARVWDAQTGLPINK